MKIFPFSRFLLCSKQDRREGGVAGATAPGPGPRQGPVEREALLYRRMLQ